MRNLNLFTRALICWFVVAHAHVAIATDSEFKSNLKTVFGEQAIDVSDHDDMLKALKVGDEYLFATHDGRYVFAGTVFDTKFKHDLVEFKKSLARKSTIESKPKTLFVSYPSTKQSSNARHQITVFTDIDCPYCRRLHATMDEINDLGISVNYVMIPRGGVGSQAYLKTQSLLCSTRPAEAITLAMRRRSTEPLECDSHQLDDQISLARELNINSTPAIVLPNGELKLGLTNPSTLAALISQNQPLKSEGEAR